MEILTNQLLIDYTTEGTYRNNTKHNVVETSASTDTNATTTAPDTSLDSISSNPDADASSSIDPKLDHLYQNLFATRIPHEVVSYPVLSQSSAHTPNPIFPKSALPYLRPVDNTWYIINRLLATICVTHPHLDHIAGLVVSSSNFSFPGECAPDCPAAAAEIDDQFSWSEEHKKARNGSSASAASARSSDYGPRDDTPMPDTPSHSHNQSHEVEEDESSYDHQPEPAECFHCTPSLPKTVAGLGSTIDALATHVFNGIVWPNLTNEGVDPVGLFSLKRLEAANKDAEAGSNSSHAPNKLNDSNFKHGISKGNIPAHGPAPFSPSYSLTAALSQNLGPNKSQHASSPCTSSSSSSGRSTSASDTHLATNLTVVPYIVSHGSVCESPQNIAEARRRSSVARLSWASSSGWRNSLVRDARISMMEGRRAASVFVPRQSQTWTSQSPSRQPNSQSQLGLSTNYHSSRSRSPPRSAALSPTSTPAPAAIQRLPSSTSPSSKRSTNTPPQRTYISTAYFIRDIPTSRELLIWGDVEPDSVSRCPRNHKVWSHAAQKIAQGKLSGILIECSFPRDSGPLFGHMAPDYLVAELEELGKRAKDAYLDLDQQTSSPDDPKATGSAATESSSTAPQVDTQALQNIQTLKGLTIVIIHVKDEDPLQLIPPRYNPGGKAASSREKQTNGSLPASSSSSSSSSSSTSNDHGPNTTPSRVILAQLNQLAEKAGILCNFIAASPGLSLYL